MSRGRCQSLKALAPFNKGCDPLLSHPQVWSRTARAVLCDRTRDPRMVQMVEGHTASRMMGRYTQVYTLSIETPQAIPEQCIQLPLPGRHGAARG